MATTAEDRQRFGQELKRLRRERGASTDAVSDALKQAGHGVSASAVAAWERGEYAPKARYTVAVLDSLLDGHGALLAALGFAITREQADYLRASGFLPFDQRIPLLPELERETLITDDDWIAQATKDRKPLPAGTAAASGVDISDLDEDDQELIRAQVELLRKRRQERLRRDKG